MNRTEIDVCQAAHVMCYCMTLMALKERDMKNELRNARHVVYTDDVPEYKDFAIMDAGEVCYDVQVTVSVTRIDR